MRALVLLVIAGCSQSNLTPGTDLAGSRDLAGADFAAADFAAAPDLATHDDLAGDACAAANGYCAPGDFVQPMCMAGWHENSAITMTGVCGLGICCVPD